MKKNVVITISNQALQKLNSLADALRDEGLEITNVFEYGVITGAVEESKLENLKKHKEIASLTEDKQINIPPPDSEVQ